MNASFQSNKSAGSSFGNYSFHQASLNAIQADQEKFGVSGRGSDASPLSAAAFHEEEKKDISRPARAALEPCDMLAAARAAAASKCMKKG